MTTTTPPDQIAGEVLRVMREATGLSLRSFAKTVGCSHQHLARLESGERALTPDIGHRISQAVADGVREKRAA